MRRSTRRTSVTPGGRPPLQPDLLADPALSLGGLTGLRRRRVSCRAGARAGSGGRRQEGDINFSHGAFRQTPPDLALAEQLDAEVAADHQPLPIGTQFHTGLIDRPIARIENGAVLVVAALALHALD